MARLATVLLLLMATTLEPGTSAERKWADLRPGDLALVLLLVLLVFATLDTHSSAHPASTCENVDRLH